MWQPQFTGYTRARLIPVIEQLISTSPDVVTMEDLIEARYPRGYDEALAEWSLPVVKSFGIPRRLLGILLMRLCDDGQVVVSLV